MPAMPLDIHCETTVIILQWNELTLEVLLPLLLDADLERGLRLRCVCPGGGDFRHSLLEILKA